MTDSVPQKKPRGRLTKQREQRDDTVDVTGGSGVLYSPMTARPPSRVGKKPVTAYLEKTAHKQLRSLGLDLEKSSQDMIVEALNDYFELHGLGRLA